MKETTIQTDKRKRVTLNTIIIVFIVSLCNLFFTGAMLFGQSYGAAMSANVHVDDPGIDIVGVLGITNVLMFLITIPASLVFLLAFKWWHKELYLPTRILALLAAFQTVANFMLLILQQY